MLVQLLSHTEEPQQVVTAAARLCYSASGIDDLLAKSRLDHEVLLNKVLALGHLSVLEHASYSQQSQRYVAHRERFAAVTPPSIAARPELAARFEGLLAEIHQAYSAFLDAGVPAEDARFILPNAAETKIVVTMNARELRHFFALRCCRRAQWEIRRMAVEMLRLARRTAPLLFAGAGPGCLAGACPEGRMSCGEMADVRQEFTDL
jgi:thymidylate synthase (FAD)